MPYAGAFDTALQADAPLVFHAVEIVLPGPVNIRLLDGAGFVTFSTKTFNGIDATYGVLGAIEDFTDGAGESSPHVRLTMLPPTNAAAATLASSANQGSTVNIWFGVIDRATGLPIGSPDLLFTGEIDVGKLIVGMNSRAVELDVASVWDRFFDNDEGISLSNAWHQSIYSGELGLEYMTDIQLQIPWGQDGPRPNVVADVLPGSGGGGGFGGGGASSGFFLFRGLFEPFR